MFVGNILNAVVLWCRATGCPLAECLVPKFELLVGPSSKCSVGFEGSGSVLISTGDKTGEITSSVSSLTCDWEANMSAFSGSSFWMLEVMSSQRGGLRKTSSSPPALPVDWLLLGETKLAWGRQAGFPTSKKSSMWTEGSLSFSSSSSFCSLSRSCLHNKVSRSDVWNREKLFIFLLSFFNLR